MRDCVYPGSFDPVTYGHKDIIRRAAGLFDTVHVGVLNNTQKRYMYDLPARLAMMERVCREFSNVKVCSSGGLLVDLMKKLGTNVIVRGLRSSADLDLEQQLAVVNAKLLPGVETIALLSRPETQYISSSVVKELIAYGADVSEYVPREITDMILRRVPL
ncbi:MAG TPA: pantetheine-phosphate adenylyltransferase [Clostridiales bacterium]|nr:pantetheine-phosphate adenylyltransferase [Clostridiales bacterium]